MCQAVFSRGESMGYKQAGEQMGSANVLSKVPQK